MTVLGEALVPFEACEISNSSLRDHIMWWPNIRPDTSIVLVHRRDLSDEAREALSKIKTFAQLRENWDSYGAEPPSNIAIQNALSFVKTLDKQRLLVFFTAPGPNGEVLVELKENDKSIETTFDNNGTALYAKFENAACVEEGSLTDQILPDLAAWLFS